MFRAGLASLVILAVGCTGSKTTVTPGNAELGISEFQISETSDRTVVVGVDWQRQEIARLDLVHGLFTPTDDYGQNAGEMIDGRKLTVAIGGQLFGWETLGYTDTLHMPKLPPEVDLVAAFVADDNVRPLLQQWYIGWAGTGEVAYDNAGDSSRAGTNPASCNGYGGSNMMCPIRITATTYGNTPGCNGSAEWMAEVVDNNVSNGDAWDGNTVFQCCGTQTTGTGSVAGYAVKTCAFNTGVSVGSGSAGSGVASCPSGHFCSACGDGGPNKCIKCGNPLNYTTDCTLWTQSAAGGKTEVFHSYDNGLCYASGTSCDGSTNCCYGNSCQDVTQQQQGLVLREVTSRTPATIAAAGVRRLPRRRRRGHLHGRLGLDDSRRRRRVRRRRHRCVVRRHEPVRGRGHLRFECDGRALLDQ